MDNKRVMEFDNMCNSCKWFVGHRGCAHDAECAECKNITDGRCNCLHKPDEGEKKCKYYVED